MDSIDIWYLKEVYLWRTVASLTWYLVSLPILFVLYAVLAQFQALHPITWITNSISGILSTYFLTKIFIVMAANGGLAWLSASSYSVTPEVADTRIRKLWWLLKPARLLHLSLYIVTAFFVSWCSSLYAGERFEGFIKYTTEAKDVFYLNEYHIVFVLYGMYTGLCFCWHFYLHQDNYLQFPVIQREKFFQVRSELVALLIRCGWQTLQQMKYFYVLYFFLGHIPRSWILHNLGLVLSPDVQPVDTVWGLFDLDLAWQLGLLGVLFNYSWSLHILLYKVYHTERFEFPVEVVFDSYKNKSLMDAITCQTKTLLQYLGYVDLLHLSRFSPARRKQVLVLSQPGGHPHVWNKLSSACLADLDSLTKQIEDDNWRAMAGVPLKSGSLSDTGDAGQSHLRYRGSTGANLSTSGALMNGHRVPASITWKEKVMSFLAQKPVLGYFFSQLPDSRSRQLLANSQKQIWAVEALSYLTAASLMEDSFGIVQRSLPSILSSLLNLHENVEKHFKLNASTGRRSQKDPPQAKDAALRFQLQSTMKTAIYRIVGTFGSHLTDVQLSAECRKKLSPFMDFRE